MMRKQRDDLSKYLSYLLRHEPQSIGLQLDDQGWADLDDLIEQSSRHGRPISRDDILEVVATSDKKRFTLSDDNRRIRAAQGHTTKSVQLEYPQSTPPEHLYHGTASRFLDSIQAHGLVPGERHHVHLTASPATALETGKRYGKPVLLRIAARKMHEQGVRFYLTENEVWLCTEVPWAFIEEADAAQEPGSE